MTEGSNLMDSKDLDCDWILQCIVANANVGISTAVTLTTAAGLVTGMVVGGIEYLDGIKGQLCHGLNDDLAKEFSDGIERWKKNYLPRNEDDESEDPAPIFIHIRDAKMLHGNQLIPVSHGYWRGKLDSIIGFSLGLMTIS